MKNRVNEFRPMMALHGSGKNLCQAEQRKKPEKINTGRYMNEGVMGWGVIQVRINAVVLNLMQC